MQLTLEITNLINDAKADPVISTVQPYRRQQLHFHMAQPGPRSQGLLPSLPLQVP